jgi:hypothetical protein
MINDIYKLILLPTDEDPVQLPKEASEPNKIVRSVWFGSVFTNIQKLCINSYLSKGHEFHLYTLWPVAGTPEGTVVKDANEFMTQRDISNFPSNSQASDYFRVLMIMKEGGWYVDLDTVCLRPLEFDEPYVFASEENWSSWPDRKPWEEQYKSSNVPQSYISNHTFKAPKDSLFLKYIANKIEHTDTLRLPCWGALGPELFSKAVPKFFLNQYVKAPITFDWMNPKDYKNFVSSGVDWDFSKEAYSVHLRTSFWKPKNDMNLNPDGKYPSDSLFELWKKENNVV